MARCVIIGCGCRGRELARALRERGHAVRGTTRYPAGAEAIREAGAEPFVGDPDRVATIAPAFAQAGVVCVLLGSATGPPEALAQLHTTRLDMLMERLIDTTARGVVYEAAGSVAADVLADGARRVRHWCERSLIPFALLQDDPAGHDAWTQSAVAAVESVLMSGG